ncbi:Uncharacterized protein TPAR_02437 [Tolypocladium paradoxum]|uniref:Uncharacterized protein n=1 Tax=Tolypocladium paradoxum TaxID=94208 RepID=A0A2S4L4H7_9HYPO|nr:Uncharacterized protein TPAR_02437 [Tolypocladium paradoxum]
MDDEIEDELNRWRAHLWLSPECGICGKLLRFHERVIGLLDRLDHVDWPALFEHKSTRPFLFPERSTLPPRNAKEYDIPAHADAWFICRRQNCNRICRNSPEATTIHHDCFEIFRQRFRSRATSEEVRTAAYEHLWRAAAWRRPWKSAWRSTPLLLPEAFNITPLALVHVADKYGMPQLATLPWELVRMIHAWSEPALFWRMAAAFDVATTINALANGTVASVPRRAMRYSTPVKDLLSWDRGYDPVLCQDQDRPPIIRLTLDSRGIRRFERLAENPDPAATARSDQLAFVVQHQSLLRGVNLQFKDGQCRLVLPNHFRGLQVWDTPSPPTVPLYRDCSLQYDAEEEDPATAGRSIFYGRNIRSGTRFYTINLCSVTGITFILGQDGAVKSIHGHTASRPFAAPSAACDTPHSAELPKRRPYGLENLDLDTWVYLPLPPQERILAVGLAESDSDAYMEAPCLIFRMKLAGTVSVGAWHPDVEPNFVLADEPEMLIFTMEELNGVKTIGSYSPRAAQGRYSTSVAQLPRSWPDSTPFDDPYFASAPLEKVVQVTVFTRNSSPGCRGFLFEYENGAQRAVGDCRLGSDACTTYSRPRSMCTRLGEPGVDSEIARDLSTTSIEFSGLTEHGHGLGEGYHCFPMSGVLKFWFNCEKIGIDVSLLPEDRDD